MRYLDMWFDDDQLKEMGRNEKVSEPAIMGHIPYWRRTEDVQLPRTKAIHRYLNHQARRIKKCLDRGDEERAILLWLMCLKSSVSYQLVLFHRTDTKWYWNKSASAVRTEFVKCADALRSWQLRINLDRFYIQKANGKLRPIGAPDRCSKMIGKAFNDMVLQLFGKDLMDTHHGFMPNRGVHTAIINIMCNYYILGKKLIYEFDLRSWFNRVNPSWVRAKLEEKSNLLANVIYQALHNTYYRWDKLFKEAELIPQGHVMKNFKWKPLVERMGLPQGSPMSPILATLALANMKTPAGLVMYADDGVLMAKEDLEYDYLDAIGKVGAEVAPEKSRLMQDGKLKFLGITMDFGAKVIHWRTQGFEYSEWNVATAIRLMLWLKKLRIEYTSQEYNTGWYWIIKRDAYLNRYRPRIGFWVYLKALWFSLWKAETYKGFRFMGWRMRDVSGASSVCCNMLAEDILQKKYKKIRPFTWIMDYADELVDKGDYVEYLSEEHGISRSNITLLPEDLAVFMMN